jgi:predicted O-methyltransferase YrrM
MAESERDIDLITRENRRLHKEVVVLRERVAALERSRWWRLHPRFLARRLTSVQILQSHGRSNEQVAQVETPIAETNPLVVRFREEVEARGTFTEDWFSKHAAAWEPILRELDGRASSLLEIGSYEGLSSCYLLWRLPDAQLTCVDTFEGSVENLTYGGSTSGLEERFDQNVALVDASRVRKLRGDSRRVVLELSEERARFDLVYVDGSHLALDVLVDASLSWPLVVPGGVLIFDDYSWALLGEDALLRPGPAVDSFLSVVEGHSEVLFKNGQVAVRKTD